MRGDPLPDRDHISRYCKPKTAPDGQPTGASFMLGRNDDFLSVNWLEYFGDIGREAQLARIRRHIPLTLAATGTLALLNVGKTVEYVHTNSGIQTLAVLHEPTPEDASHSGIHGYKHEDDLVADLIAGTVQEIYPAREP